MSKKTKNAPKRLTRRQAEIKADKIFRGLDNSIARIKKETASMAEGAEVLKRDVLPALSQDDAPAKKPEAPAKPVRKAKPKAPAKPVRKAKPKAPSKSSRAQSAKPKPAKKASPAKPAPKPVDGEEKKAVPTPDSNPPVEGRPTIKEACVQLIGEKGGKCSATDLYYTACGRWGYWSRQSLYNSLKDKKTFRKVGDLYEVVTKPQKGTGTQDAEADAFVKTVTKDQTVSQAI